MLIITPFSMLILISIRLGLKPIIKRNINCIYHIQMYNIYIYVLYIHPSNHPCFPQLHSGYHCTHQTMLLNRKGNIHLLGIIYLRRFFSLLFVTVVQLESNFYAFNFRNIFIIIFLLVCSCFSMPMRAKNLGWNTLASGGSGFSIKVTFEYVDKEHWKLLNLFTFYVLMGIRKKY